MKQTTWQCLYIGRYLSIFVRPNPLIQCLPNLRNGVASRHFCLAWAAILNFCQPWHLKSEKTFCSQSQIWQLLTALETQGNCWSNKGERRKKVLTMFVKNNEKLTYPSWRSTYPYCIRLKLKLGTYFTQIKHKPLQKKVTIQFTCKII